MRLIVSTILLMMSIHTTSSAETATSGNLLPNAGTGTTSTQNQSGNIDGINSSSGWTLDSGITDFSQYGELEAQGTGTVSASGSLLNITTEKETGGPVSYTHLRAHET